MDNNQEIYDINADISTFRNIKKCTAKGCNCRTRAVIAQEEGDDVRILGYCSRHFKMWAKHTNYGYSTHCISCEYNFCCAIQKVLYTKREINEFKNELKTNTIELEE